MKKNHLISLLSLIIISCSTSNDIVEAPRLTSYISHFHFEQLDPILGLRSNLDSINYLIEDNKFRSGSGKNINLLTGEEIELGFDYLYDNNRLSKVEQTRNGVLHRSYFYNYNSNGDLSEYIRFTPSSSNYRRIAFNYTNDTIYATRDYSTDGITYNNIDREIKYVIDNNDNCVFYEYKLVNFNFTSTDFYEYENDNLTVEAFFNSNPNNSGIINQFNYNLNTVTNTLNVISEASFSKKTLMLLHPLDNKSVNQIQARKIAKNPITNFTTTFVNSNFSVDHTTNEENFATLSEYVFGQFGATGSLVTRTTITDEFIFSQD